MSEYTGPLPVPTPDTKPFWDAARRHELTLPRCRPCGSFFFFPRSVCPRCLSADVEWRQVSGRGTLHTFTVVHRGAKGFPLSHLPERLRQSATVAGVCGHASRSLARLAHKLANG